MYSIFMCALCSSHPFIHAYTQTADRQTDICANTIMCVIIELKWLAGLMNLEFDEAKLSDKKIFATTKIAGGRGLGARDHRVQVTDRVQVMEHDTSLKHDNPAASMLPFLSRL